MRDLPGVSPDSGRAVKIEGGSALLGPSAFEDFSDRFLAGTDTAHTPALRFYEERINAFRQMLSQMSPATAKRIAYENAERLFAARRIP